ncbi:hypothetical protein GCM10028805_54200 [Spirosoma harenae]
MMISTIKAAQGEILALGLTQFGFVIRAMVNGRSYRIITQLPSQKLQNLPKDTDCETLFVTDERHLQTWRNTLSTNCDLPAV